MFRSPLDIQTRLNRFFSETPFRGDSEGLFSADWTPAVDVQETEKEYVIKAELPEIAGLGQSRVLGRESNRGTAMTPDESTIHQWLLLIQAEYLEMPGLQLTKRQVQRLWTLEPRVCDAVLDELVATHFLKKTLRNAYVLADGDLP